MVFLYRRKIPLPPNQMALTSVKIITMGLHRMLELDFRLAVLETLLTALTVVDLRKLLIKNRTQQEVGWICCNNSRDLWLRKLIMAFRDKDRLGNTINSKSRPHIHNNLNPHNSPINNKFIHQWLKLLNSPSLLTPSWNTSTVTT